MRAALTNVLFTRPQSPLLASLVAYWKLSDLSDSVGANHFTNVNGATFVAGKIGNACQFAVASTQRLTLADGGLLSIGASPVTFAGWVYVDSLAVARSFFGKRTGTNEYTCEVQGTGTARFLAWAGGALKVSGTAAGAVTVSTWHFILAHFDPTAQEIGISVNNGTPATASTGAGAIDTGGTTFQLGASGGGGTPMDGKMDEWSMWRRLLTADEKAALYNGGVGRTYPFFA